MKSLWRFTSGFGNKARLNVPPLASRWRLSDGRENSFRAPAQDKRRKPAPGIRQRRHT
jgi:hypothetical protein